MEQPPAVGYNFPDAGEYELVIAGRPARHYTVEVSCDLVEWRPLATTLADSAGMAYFRDKTVLTHGAMASKTGGTDPWCGPNAVAAATTAAVGMVEAVESAESRFYRVLETP